MHFNYCSSYYWHCNKHHNLHVNDFAIDFITIMSVQILYHIYIYIIDKTSMTLTNRYLGKSNKDLAIKTHQHNLDRISLWIPATVGEWTNYAISIRMNRHSIRQIRASYKPSHLSEIKDKHYLCINSRWHWIYENLLVSNQNLIAKIGFIIYSVSHRIWYQKLLRTIYMSVTKIQIWIIIIIRNSYGVIEENIGGGIEIDDEDGVRDTTPTLAATAGQNDVLLRFCVGNFTAGSIWISILISIFNFSFALAVVLKPTGRVQRHPVFLVILHFFFLCPKLKMAEFTTYQCDLQIWSNQQILG